MVSFLNKTHFKATDFYQPNFVRSRQALRSPINSEQINLEMSLFAYDITRLFKRVEAFEVLFEEDMTVLDSSADTSISFTVKYPAEVSSDLVNFEGIESILNTLESFEKRLQILEQGL